MNAMRRKALVVALGMSGAAALAKLGIPTQKIADGWKTDLEEMFPVAFGDWRLDVSMPVILPAPDVQAKLDAIYNQILTRTYINKRTGDRVMLSVAYGGDQSDALAAHLPEVCYPAQGFALEGSTTVDLAVMGRTVPARRIATRLGGRYEPVTYWLTLGETVAATMTQRKLAQMRYGLRGQIPDGMLIRVSTIDRDAARAFEVQERFIASMVAAVPPHALSRVVGAAASAA